MTFDVFVSYSRDDQSEVIKLSEALKARGLNVWLDIWELQPGVPFQKALEEIIKGTNAVAIVVGASGIGPWQNVEMRACIQQFVERGMTVIPVMLSNAKEEPKLPLFLSGLTWVDFRKGSEIESLARLEWGITGKKPQSYQNLVHPLYQHERDFLQILLTHFSLLRLEKGIKLEVCFDHNTPAISKREARRYLRKNIDNFDEKVKSYEKKLNAFIVSRKGEACNISDSEFMFRYASGGTLPIIRLNNIDYYCLFFRGIHPIGWNIANGGCNNLEELLYPLTTIMRELREELIMVDSENWYIFKSNDSAFYDRPEFAIARQFWDMKFDKLGFRRFNQLKNQLINFRYLSGPDHLNIKYANDVPLNHKDIYITITAEDFGIEIDKIILIDMKNVENLILCDGEINDLYSVNRPVGLFRISDFDIESTTNFIPEIFYYNANYYKGNEFKEIVQSIALEDMKNSTKHKEKKEIIKEFENAIKNNDFQLCPVAYQIIKRYQKLIKNKL